MRIFKFKQIVLFIFLLIGSNLEAKIIITPDINPIPLYEGPIEVQPKTYFIQNPELGLIYDVELLDKSPLRFKVELCISIINNETKAKGEYYYHIVGWIDKANCGYIKETCDKKANDDSNKRENSNSAEIKKWSQQEYGTILDYTKDSLHIMNCVGNTLKIEWIER